MSFILRLLCLFMLAVACSTAAGMGRPISQYVEIPAEDCVRLHGEAPNENCRCMVLRKPLPLPPQSAIRWHCENSQ
ncbi:Hypothetical protein NTJ_14105 [Nesidiocoris tenuis]|uniref:Single domain-containing protein n=1 Tax=Nesidiocoris tenuis TaxID=355587 RepID=A0ABN7BAK1_9HEMI|nr:Hypothetical protein NTJ_14105 [Nesidiocoris tenuis]